MIAATEVRGAAYLVDFNTPGELTNHFSLNVNVGNSIRYTQVASGGLGNSGAVGYLNTLEADHTTAALTDASFDFSGAGDSVTVSMMILRQNAVVSSTPFMMLGILSDVGERMDAGTASNSYASIRIMPDPSSLATGVFLQTETKLNGGSRVRVTPGLTASLAAGNWYRMSATFDFSSLTDLTMSAALEDWGTTGAVFQSTVLSLPATLIALSGADQVNGDASVWAAFRGFREGGVSLSDDFRAVPEPASLLLLGAAVLHRLRGRRQARRA